MLTFIENTWMLWWLIAIVAVLRWFYVSALGTEVDEAQESRSASASHEITAQLI